MAPLARKFTFDLRFDEPSPAWTEDAEGQDFLEAGKEEAFAALTPEDSVAEEAKSVEISDDSLPAERFYSEQEAEAIRNEAFAAGRDAALKQASEENEQSLAHALHRCEDAFVKLLPRLDEGRKTAAALAATVALEICRKLLPHTADLYAAREIEALLEGLMPQLLGQPSVIVRANARIADSLQDVAAKLAKKTGFRGEMSVLEDAALDVSDVRIEWADGGAERDSRRLWTMVEAVIARNIPLFSKGESMDIGLKIDENEDENRPESNAIAALDVPKEADDG